MIFGLMPHGYCFLWDIGLTSLHVLADGAIAVAYFSIPTVMYLNRDRVTDEMQPLMLMFAAFILSCGIGHVIAAWNIWHGNYWVEGVWKAVIAGISLATAWHLKGEIPNFLGLHRQLTETQMLANTDPLTGLANRRGLEQALEQLLPVPLTAAQRGHVLMLIDLDHFKQVNDRYGHTTGDRLLQSVAQTLSRHTRSTDIVARLGGDEFAVLLTGCSLPKGHTIATAILQDLRTISLEDGPGSCDQPPMVTASIGLHRLESSHKSFLSIFQRVDKLLYTSKQAGRDRITIASSEATG